MSTQATSAAQLLSAARHPSTTSARLRGLVADLPWPVLREAWESTRADLQVAGTDEAALALVLLREALLDEMERSRPGTYGRWSARASWSGWARWLP
jgi:hypothetical protein